MSTWQRRTAVYRRACRSRQENGWWRHHHCCSRRRRRYWWNCYRCRQQQEDGYQPLIDNNFRKGGGFRPLFFATSRSLQSNEASNPFVVARVLRAKRCQKRTLPCGSSEGLSAARRYRDPGLVSRCCKRRQYWRQCVKTVETVVDPRLDSRLYSSRDALERRVGRYQSFIRLPLTRPPDG